MRRLIFLTSIFSVLFSQQTYDSEIQPIFNNNCTSCHGTSGNLDLSQGNSYNNLVNVASQGWPSVMRVKPGEYMNSVLHQKIVGNTAFGDRMPQGGSALAQADEEKIKNWILNGAPSISTVNLPLSFPSLINRNRFLFAELFSKNIN